MNKYLLSFSLLSLIITSGGVAAYTQTYPDDVFKERDLSDNNQMQGIYTDIYKQDVLSTTESSIALATEQMVLSIQKNLPANASEEDRTRIESLKKLSLRSFSNQEKLAFNKISSLNAGDELFTFQIKVGDLFEEKEVQQLCRGEQLFVDKSETAGFTPLQILTSKEQLNLSSQIANLCAKSKEMLQFKSDLAFDTSMEGLFSDTRTDNSPFDLSQPLHAVDRSISGQAFTGIAPTPEEGEYLGVTDNYSRVSWADPNVAYNSTTGTRFDLVDSADPNADIVPQPIPRQILFQQNTLEPHQNERVKCPALSPEDCDDEISKYKDTENKPLTEDSYILGLLGRIKATTATMNDKALAGGRATTSFGGSPMVGRTANSNGAALPESPGDMLLEQTPSYDQSESSNATLEAQLSDITEQYASVEAKILYESPCAVYVSLNRNAFDALDQVENCKARRKRELIDQLELIAQNDKQLVIQQGVQKQIGTTQQLMTEMASFQKSMENIEKTFERLNDKRRVAFFLLRLFI